ncbi:MAG TPA: hypothetical protein VGN12_22600 [Pirellulales bacterium]|jgi:uncharacterized transporter YbjL
MAHTSSIRRQGLKFLTVTIVLFMGCVTAWIATHGFTMPAIAGLGTLAGALIAVLMASKETP